MTQDKEAIPDAEFTMDTIEVDLRRNIGPDVGEYEGWVFALRSSDAGPADEGSTLLLVPSEVRRLVTILTKGLAWIDGHPD